MDNSGPSPELGPVAGLSSQPASDVPVDPKASTGLSSNGSVARRNLRARPSEPSSVTSPSSKRARADTNTKLRPPTEKELDSITKALSEESLAVKRDGIVREKEAEVKRVVDGHDDAVREKFHLERFISIFEGWDPKDAKQDNSPVFLEYKRSQYNLLNLMPSIPPSQVAGPSRSRASLGSRTTRRQANEQTELFSSESARQPEPTPSSTPSSKSKGKGRQSNVEPTTDVEVLVKPKLGRPFKVRNEEMLPPPIPDKGKGKGKGRRATMDAVPVEEVDEETTIEDVEPPLKKRRGRPPRLSLPNLPAQTLDDESPSSPAIRDSPDPQQAPVPAPSLPSLAHLPFPPPPTQPRRRPRGPRTVYYTDFAHLPTTTPKHNGDLNAILESYIHLEDTGPSPDIKTLELKAATEAYYRNRVNYLQHQGRLLRLLDDDSTSNAKISTKPPTLPPRKTDYQDSLLAHMIQVRTAMLNEARLKPIVCKKIARMIQGYWEHIEGKDDRERLAEEKRRKLQMKELIKSLRRRWALAVKVVRAKLVQMQKEEQDRLGKEHLQNMLQRSTGLLDAHRDEFAGREGDNEDEDEEGSSGTDEVSSADDSEEDEDSDEDGDEEAEAEGLEEDGMPDNQEVDNIAASGSNLGLPADDNDDDEQSSDDDLAEDHEGGDDINIAALLADDEVDVNDSDVGGANAEDPLASASADTKGALNNEDPAQANGIDASSLPTSLLQTADPATQTQPQDDDATPITNGELPETTRIPLVPNQIPEIKTDLVPTVSPPHLNGEVSEPPADDEAEFRIIRPRSKRQRARKVFTSTTPEVDPDAADVEFKVDQISDIDEKDHAMDVEMEDNVEGGDADSEDDGLLADADLPIEELLRRYGVPMPASQEATPVEDSVQADQPVQAGLHDQVQQVEVSRDLDATEQPEQPQVTELSEQVKVELGDEKPVDESLVDAAIPQPTSPALLIEGKRQRRVRSVWTPEENPPPPPKKPKVQIISAKGEVEPEILEEEEESDPHFTSSEEESSEDEADEAMDGVEEEDKEPVDPNRLRAPFLLRGSLRPYQHAGLEWLASLYTNNMNGILADEMGLGKTIQTISLLAHLACDKGIWGQHLIIVPTSVILNWEMEFKKFLPGMKVLTYYGNQKERKEKRIGWATQHHFQVCITSYQIVLADQHIFRRKNWVYMILDEAHNIKNFRSQRWQTLLGFKAQRRLLLTGTPLQNNLMELWSLLYFLMPGGVGANDTAGVGFANHKEFTEWFSNPMDKAVESGDVVDEEILATISKLHTLLRPFILRRLKSEVETQLPGKFEHVVYCKLSKRQRFLYDEFMDRASTKEALTSGGYLGVVNTLMQLRKVCNHPDLFEVRPVRTSFAMDPVVGEYEPVELLVRKRLLAEGDEKINLEALNLKITENEDVSAWVCQTRQQLDASDRLPYAIEPVSTKKGKQNVGPPLDTLTVDGWLKYRAWNEEQKSISRWRSLRDKNRIRCSAKPIYGSTLLTMLSNIPNVLHPLSLPSTRPHWFGEHDPPASQLVASLTDRSRVLEPVVNLYAVIPPNVVARDLSRYALPGFTPLSHPALTDPSFDTLHQSTVKLQIAFPDSSLLQYDCGKLQTLYTMLRDLKAGGHRVLIFTQMTRVLDILEMFLSYNGHRYLRLDGSTKIEDRQIITERFNSDNRIFCFIASSRSGGVGINLTGADTVFFYDSDWNPSMDRQCMDRAHRIGQTREVHIYRFVSTHTVEENMLKKANQKRMLDKVVIQEGEFTTDFFGKMDWRDVIDPISDGPATDTFDQTQDQGKIEDIDMEEEPQAVDQEVLRPRAGEERELAKALAEVEDEEDAAAARIAQNEGELDFEEFDADKEKEKAIPKRVGFQNVADEGSATPAPAAQDGEEEEEEAEEDDDGIGGVDEYMLKFVEWDWEFFVRYRA